MKSNPDLDARLQARLREAIEQFDGGSADAFGRRIGYTNGGYLREVLSGKKPTREALIDRVHAVIPGWFSALLVSAAPAPNDWPFEALTRARFAKLTPRQQGRVEQALLDLVERIERESTSTPEPPRPDLGRQGYDPSSAPSFSRVDLPSEAQTAIERARTGS